MDLHPFKELGASLESKDTGGRTPAHYAASNGRVEVLRLLKDLHANSQVVKMSQPQAVLFNVSLVRVA